MQLLLFGTGYIGLRVARLWRATIGPVTTVTRNAARAQQFAAEGFTPAVADVTEPATLAGLPPTDAVLFAVGFDRQAGPDIRAVYAAGLQNVLAATRPPLRRVVYVSSTGVYGPAAGEWVDEQTPPAPQREGGLASLAAEEVLRASRFADRGISLRLAGIYGPGRIPYRDDLMAGRPIAAPQAGWLNLIHADDAATACLAALVAEGHLPPVVNVGDGQPVVRADYYREVARRLGTAAPQFCDPPADSPKAARAAADRRVRCELLRTSLGVELRYPTYREGLAQALGGA